MANVEVEEVNKLISESKELLKEENCTYCTEAEDRNEEETLVLKCNRNLNLIFTDLIKFYKDRNIENKKAIATIINNLKLSNDLVIKIAEAFLRYKEESTAEPVQEATEQQQNNQIQVNAIEQQQNNQQQPQRPKRQSTASVACGLNNNQQEVPDYYKTDEFKRISKEVGDTIKFERGYQNRQIYALYKMLHSKYFDSKTKQLMIQKDGKYLLHELTEYKYDKKLFNCAFGAKSFVSGKGIIILFNTFTKDGVIFNADSSIIK